MHQTLLLTGFEPFLDVEVNPSGEIAQRLAGTQYMGPGGAVEVVSVVLPVSFARAPGALDEAISALQAPPVAIVSMGVHRGHEFRLETHAGTHYGSAKPDNDGEWGDDVELLGPASLVTPFDLELCATWLEGAGAAATMISEDAGGYLCERVYRAGLEASAAPAIFLHVPPLEMVGVDAQMPVVHGFLERLVAHLLSV